MPPRTVDQKARRAENSKKSSDKKKVEQQVIANKLVVAEAKLAKFADFAPNSTIYPHDPTQTYMGLARDLRLIRKHMMENVVGLPTIAGIIFPCLYIQTHPLGNRVQMCPEVLPEGPVFDAHTRIKTYLTGLVTVFENEKHGTTDEVYDLAAFAYMVAPRGQPGHTDLAYNIELRAGEQESSQVR
jgi:hypothetical protein